jgi:predicted DNA-binding transcriptional regulator AlpA
MQNNQKRSITSAAKVTTAASPAQDQGIPTALRNFDAYPDSAFVRLPTVAGLFAQSRASIWRNVKLGRLPAPRKFSPRVTAWQVGDLRRALKGL